MYLLANLLTKLSML